MIPTISQSGALFTANNRDNWLSYRLHMAIRFETKLLRRNLRQQRRLRFHIRFLKLRSRLSRIKL